MPQILSLVILEEKKLNTRDILGQKLGKSLGGYVFCSQSSKLVDHLFFNCIFFSITWEAISSSELAGVLSSDTTLNAFILKGERDFFNFFFKSALPVILMLTLEKMKYEKCFKQACLPFTS